MVNPIQVTANVNRLAGKIESFTPNYTAGFQLHGGCGNDLGGTGHFYHGQNDISNASPEHNVTLPKGFYLGKYEVTQAQYEAVMAEYGNR